MTLGRSDMFDIGCVDDDGSSLALNIRVGSRARFVLFQPSFADWFILDIVLGAFFLMRAGSPAHGIFGHDQVVGFSGASHWPGPEVVEPVFGGCAITTG